MVQRITRSSRFIATHQCATLLKDSDYFYYVDYISHIKGGHSGFSIARAELYIVGNDLV